MRIGKQDAPYTAISTSDAASITVRGHDLCGELIGKIDFTDYFFLLLMGKKPTENQRFFVNALLVAIAEHGLVPSVQAARMTLAAAPEALQGAVAAGLLGSGSVVLGSAETAGYFLHDLVAASADRPAAEVAIERIREMRKTKTAIPGFGHPQHSGGDPRANVLLKLCRRARPERPLYQDAAHGRRGAARSAGPAAADQHQWRHPGDPSGDRLSGDRAQEHFDPGAHRRTAGPSARRGGALDRLYHVPRRRRGHQL